MDLVLVAAAGCAILLFAPGLARRLGRGAGRIGPVSAVCIVVALLAVARGAWLAAALLAAPPIIQLALSGRPARARAGASAASPPESEPERAAREILGVGKGADAAEINAAHRRLIRDIHPDRGGGQEAAARANHARDVLLAALGGGSSG